jgi:asparagine synthase (glutamine-hydrolysing)
MCGINGILRLHPAAPAIDRDEVLRTREAMASRGPDGAGLWIDAAGRIALASRRLAILDLSRAADQPMASGDGRYRLVFNGELYNFRALREELERGGARFRTRSDTEVVIAAWAAWGPAMFPRLRGMYALALWDTDEERLLLARDPFGIKPLYYSLAGGVLRFASQVKALEAGGAISRALDPGALAGFLVWGSVPEPLTIRQEVRALPAGSYAIAGERRLEAPVRHATFGDAAAGSLSAHEPTAPAAQRVAAALADSVAAHLVADVPVGIFLSAGLDSAMVTALARRALSEPPTTLTVRFASLRGTADDEGPLAARVAAVLGTRHVERQLGADDLRNLWPAALAAMDQPSIDGVNTFVISRVAHEQGLKVVLSGLGGDELFGGYPSFRQVPRLWRAARAASAIPGVAGVWSALARPLLRRRPKTIGVLRHGATVAGAYLLRRAVFLPEELPAILGEPLAAEGLSRFDPLSHAGAALAGAGSDGREGDAWTAVHRLETACYLRNQLLRDSDWASMASSVELRVPLVDPRLHAVVAAAGFEPARSFGKSAVATTVAPELPAEVVARRKSGFFVPLAAALEGAAPGSHGMGARTLALRLLEELGVRTTGQPPPRRPTGGPTAGVNA